MAKKLSSADPLGYVGDAETTHFGNTVDGSPLKEVLVRATENIVMESINNKELDMSNKDIRTNDTRSKSVQRMTRRMQAELDIITDEVEEIDREIARLNVLRTEKMHAASMLSHGLAAGE